MVLFFQLCLRIHRQVYCDKISIINSCQKLLSINGKAHVTQLATALSSTPPELFLWFLSNVANSVETKVLNSYNNPYVKNYHTLSCFLTFFALMFNPFQLISCASMNDFVLESTQTNVCVLFYEAITTNLVHSLVKEALIFFWLMCVNPFIHHVISSLKYVGAHETLWAGFYIIHVLDCLIAVGASCVVILMQKNGSSFKVDTNTKGGNSTTLLFLRAVYYQVI